MNAKKAKAIRRFCRQPQLDEEGNDMVPGVYALYNQRQFKNGKPMPITLSGDCWRFFYKGVKHEHYSA